MEKELYINVITGEQVTREVDLDMSSVPEGKGLNLDIGLAYSWLRELADRLSLFGIRLDSELPFKEE